jgi:hypothetical protein
LFGVLRRFSMIDLFDGRLTLVERIGSGLLPMSVLLGVPVRAMARPFVILSHLLAAWGGSSYPFSLIVID